VSTPVLLVLVALLTFAAGRALVHLRTADLERRLEELQNAHDQAVADSASRSRRYDEQRALVGRGASLDRRLKVVSALDHERLVWPQLLAEIGAALPDEAYLTALEARTRVPLTVELRGRAGDTFAVTQFISALQSSASIGAVRLLGTDARVEGVDLGEPRLERSFLIEVDYQLPSESLPELK
jgi:Tfp pilus assembly protein PilN